MGGKIVQSFEESRDFCFVKKKKKRSRNELMFDFHYPHTQRVLKYLNLKFSLLYTFSWLLINLFKQCRFVRNNTLFLQQIDKTRLYTIVEWLSFF